MFKLVVQSGKHKGKRIAIPQKEVLLGRDESCYVRLASTDISRHHCSLQVTNQSVRIRDLGSQNGTFVNGKRILAPVLLNDGDIVQVGPLRFQIEGETPATNRIDDDIAGWLTDSSQEIDLEKAGSLTTIVTAPPLDRRGAAAPPAPAIPAPRPVFNSIAEEARDIIRRHREALGGPTV